MVTNGVSCGTLVSELRSLPLLRHVLHALHGRPLLQSSVTAYVEILQVLWNNICPDFLPLNNISSVLGMATSRAGSRSLVETLVGLLGGESKLARSTSPGK